MHRNTRPPPRPAALCAAVLSVLLIALLLPTAPAAAADRLLLTPSGWPLAGPVTVLKGFDPPDTPWGSGHRGVDLAAAVGDPILAAAAGRVSYAGRLAGRGVVVVDHGTVRTTYEPVAAAVGVGDHVAAGQPIGRLAAGNHCGDTPCLHWGLLQGRTYLDPLGPGAGTSLQGNGQVRLLPAAARAVAQKRAEARAAAAARAAVAGAQGNGVQGNGLQSSDPTGTRTRHGFRRPVPGAITSGFGRRFHPVLHRWKLHDGTDLGATCGTPIRAPARGVVTRTYLDPAYGHRLFLDHGAVDGRHVVTGYNHATHYVVEVGARVSRGQLIGYVGATGYATGCHLHLMVWLDGRLTNPVTWF